LRVSRATHADVLGTDVATHRAMLAGRALDTLIGNAVQPASSLRFLRAFDRLAGRRPPRADSVRPAGSVLADEAGTNPAHASETRFVPPAIAVVVAGLVGGGPRVVHRGECPNDES